MNELRKDPTRGQWVLIRPEPPAGDGSECPYCPGAEAASGPEIAAYRKDGSAPNTPGWMVRVVAERDPYFRIEDDTGERYWVFRAGDGEDPLTGSQHWFLHGIFG